MQQTNIQDDTKKFTRLKKHLSIFAETLKKKWENT